METVTDQLLALIFETGRALRERTLRGRLPLSLPQFAALWFIHEHDAPTMRDLARHLRVRPPSATFIAEELVRGGFVRRSADSVDGRCVRLGLSKNGKAVLARAVRAQKNAVRGIFGALDIGDQRELVRILGKLTQPRPL